MRRSIAGIFAIALVGSVIASSPAPSLATQPITPTDDVVAVGSYFTCAVAANGIPWCWGNDVWGTLGDGAATTQARATPQPMTGVASAVAIEAGDTHACALLANGSIQCWGRAADNYLGNGVDLDSATPFPVTVNGISDATHLTVGPSHSCAIRTDQTVACWGSNNVNLGNSSNAETVETVPVSDLSGAVDVSAGLTHSSAVIDGGEIKCWGNNAYGQIGDGTQTHRTSPVAVSGISNAIAVAAATWFSCALLETGEVKCWGSQ